MEKISGRYPLKISAIQGRIIVLQLAVMLNSGVTITRALEALSKAEEKHVRLFGFAVLRSISTGHSLTQGLAMTTDFFSESHLSLLKTGEETGKLALLLSRLADELEREQNVRRQLWSAMIYPLGIFLLTTGMALFMTNFMLPQLLSATGSALKDPSLPTRVLSSLAQHGGTVTMLFLVALCSLPWLYSPVPQAKAMRNWILYESPLFGRLTYNLELSGLTRQLALKLHTGLTIRESLATLHSRVAKLEVGFKTVLEELTKGASIKDSFLRAEVFEHDFVAMIEMGEETGRVASALESQAEFLEINARRDLQGLIKLIEPLSLIVLGFFVAFVVLGCFLPIYQVAGQSFQ